MTLFVWDEISDEIIPISDAEPDDCWATTGSPGSDGVQEWRSTDGRNYLSLSVEAPDDEAARQLFQAHPLYPFKD